MADPGDALLFAAQLAVTSGGRQTVLPNHRRHPGADHRRSPPGGVLGVRLTPSRIPSSRTALSGGASPDPWAIASRCASGSGAPDGPDPARFFRPAAQAR